MAGLIQQQMMDPATSGQVNDAMQGAGAGGQPNPDNEQAEVNENDPNFQKALNFAMKVLYEKEAAKDIAKQIRAAQDPVDGLADIAYNITQVVDEQTQGAVPDELLVPLAMQILEEVVEIAGAANVEVGPADVAAAFKQMILRYLGEQGIDTTQLQQAMDQVDPAVFEQAASENTEQEVPV